jgi:hypothetical protein
VEVLDDAAPDRRVPPRTRSLCASVPLCETKRNRTQGHEVTKKRTQEWKSSMTRRRIGASPRTRSLCASVPLCETKRNRTQGHEVTKKRTQDWKSSMTRRRIGASPRTRSLCASVPLCETKRNRTRGHEVMKKRTQEWKSSITRRRIGASLPEPARFVPPCLCVRQKEIAHEGTKSRRSVRKSGSPR